MRAVIIQAVCIALMLLGVVVEILTPQQFIAGILWVVPIALSGLTFSRRFTIGLVVAAVVLSGLVTWYNSLSPEGLDTISVLNRLLLAAAGVMVGVMTNNLSDFSQQLGRLQEREKKLRQERDLERLMAAITAAHNRQEAFALLVPVLHTQLGCGVVLGLVQDGKLAASSAVAGMPDVVLGQPLDPRLSVVHLPQQTVLGLTTSNQTALEPLLPALERALERVWLLENLSRERSQLVQRNSIIRDLIYAFSHDLRTPLMANAMNIKLALDGAFGQLPKDYLESLKNGLSANQDLLELAEKLLLVAKFESGEVSPQTQSIVLDQAIQQMISRLMPMAQQKSIRFVLELAPVQMRGNSLDVGRVLQNLLDNAIKFCPVGQAIEVRLHAASTIRLEVTDPGEGVPIGSEQRLFSRFSSGKAGGGSGLGLYLAKRIVEAHQGQIGYTRHAHTTTFWVEFPRSI